MARIAFLLDEHVPHAVAEALRRREIDVLTSSEEGLLSAANEEYLTRATRDRRVIDTHDADFLLWHGRGREHPGIVCCAQGARSIGQIVAGLLLIHDVLELEAVVGRVEYL